MAGRRVTIPEALAQQIEALDGPGTSLRLNQKVAVLLAEAVKRHKPSAGRQDNILPFPGRR